MVVESAKNVADITLILFEEPVEAEEDLSMRGEAGLNEFRRSGQTLTRADLQLGRKPGDADDRDITYVFVFVN